MFGSTEEFFQAAESSILVFDAWVVQAKPSARADHLCYKCGSTEEFEKIRALFESQSGFVYQSIISERRIAIVRFKKPITTSLGQIWYLELSDQKPDGSQKSGFDHIEIYPTHDRLEGLVAELQDKGVVFEKIVRPHHTTYDTAIEGTFKVRLEAEPLIEKIKREEMR